MDYQSLFFLIGDHLPHGAQAPVPVHKSVLTAQAHRLGRGLRLPEQLRLFLEELGSGEFRFGCVFSPVPDEDGSSELDRELEDFREAQVERLRRLCRPALEVDLLPFARNRQGTVFLFNLLDQAEPDRLWVWESEAEGDDASPSSETFWDFLASRYRAELTGLEVTLHQFRQAVREQRVIELSYRHQALRTLHPHRLSPDGAGEVMLLALQVAGYVEPGAGGKTERLPHLKSFHPALCSQVRLSGATFEWTGEQLRALAAWEDVAGAPTA